MNTFYIDQRQVKMQTLTKLFLVCIQLKYLLFIFANLSVSYGTLQSYEAIDLLCEQ